MKEYVKALQGGISTSRTTEFMMANVVESTRRGSEGAAVVMEAIQNIGSVATQNGNDPRNIAVGSAVVDYALGKTGLETFTRRLEEAVPAQDRSQRLIDVLEASHAVMDQGPTRERLEALGRAQHAMQDGQPGPMADLAAEAAVRKHEEGADFDFVAFREEKGINAALGVDDFIPQMRAPNSPWNLARDTEDSFMDKSLATLEMDPDQRLHLTPDSPSM